MKRKIKKKLFKIKLLLLDVDGVLTDGGIYIDNKGNEIKRFNVKDGSGIKMAKQCGIEVGLITGRKSKIVITRAKELEVKLVYQGVKKKHLLLEKIIKDLKVKKEEIAYIGDDVIDLKILKEVGCKVAVNDAHFAIKKNADIVTKKRGGEGAVREFIDILLKEKGLWEDGLKRYA